MSGNESPDSASAETETSSCYPAIPDPTIPDDQLTIRQLALRVISKDLNSSNARVRATAIRNYATMARLDQAAAFESVRSQQRGRELDLKEALVEQRGGVIGEAIPTGVVLLERPSPTLEAWQSELDEAARHDSEPIEVPNPE